MAGSEEKGRADLGETAHINKRSIRISQVSFERCWGTRDMVKGVFYQNLERSVDEANPLYWWLGIPLMAGCGFESSQRPDSLRCVLPSFVGYHGGYCALPI